MKVLKIGNCQKGRTTDRQKSRHIDVRNNIQSLSFSPVLVCFPNCFCQERINPKLWHQQGNPMQLLISQTFIQSRTGRNYVNVRLSTNDENIKVCIKGSLKKRFDICQFVNQKKRKTKKQKITYQSGYYFFGGEIKGFHKTMEISNSEFCLIFSNVNISGWIDYS